jgi:lysyl endopeptidase
LRVALAALATLPLTFTLAAGAAPAAAVSVVRADLGSLIRAAAGAPVQFAVPVPHAASTATSGSWSAAEGEATWRYAVQVPTAVSLSFHAVASSLPESATLLVSGGQATTSYRSADVHRGELWSRIHAGDTLELTLTVAAADRDRVALQIVSLQAGFRAIGPGVEDHPVYKLLVARGAAPADPTSCVTNYECKVTPGNTPAGAATAALVVENLYQCTGTLINDVPGDNTPYVLTARHCETGRLGGGNPQAAAGVTVYWNATSACGTPLGSIYDGSLPSQTGAHTVVEQQDAWLIELDASPMVADAQFAGFDVSGAPVQGGYTIQQAGGLAKQFVGWFGTAFAWETSDDLGTAYVSSFLQTVNQTGNIGPGASGGGLFDSNNHLVGALTLGRKSSNSSGYGACPVTPLSAPNGSNGVADFTPLAAVWRATADRTSSTGGATLRAALDPAGTGVLIVPSMPVSLVASGAAPAPAPRISFDPSGVSAGQSFTATWSATNAANCTLTGGIPGGTWGGSTQSVPASGSVTESGPAGSYTFGLVCQSLEASGASVATQRTLTIAPDAASFAPGSVPVAETGGIGAAGGGGALGVLEAAVLAALLALRHIRSTRAPARLRSARRALDPRRRFGQDEGALRGRRRQPLGVVPAALHRLLEQLRMLARKCREIARASRRPCARLPRVPRRRPPALPPRV